MLIIIDGYNLIRQSLSLKRCENKSLEAGRNALIKKLAEYEKKKAHRITVVFDGGKSDWMDEGRDRAGNINIIYSRRGERADDVIKRIAAQAVGDVIVVSSDREISSFITRIGHTPLTSPEFEVIMNKAIYTSSEKIRQERKTKIAEQKKKKKGPAKRLPRTQRKVQAKINKL
ncbi:MAG: NYN domain-containing protein [Syntrophaceae bacterium]|nr:NYN domain-containing protein [Syntrophaceae bacterium]